MKDNPIVGVLAAATRDHLLIDVPLHIALCGKNPKGRVIFEAVGGRGSSGYVLRVWNESNRQCSWCVKKLAKIQRKDL